MQFKIDENLLIEIAELLIGREPLNKHLGIAEEARIRIRGKED